MTILTLHFRSSYCPTDPLKREGVGSDNSPSRGLERSPSRQLSKSPANAVEIQDFVIRTARTKCIYADDYWKLAGDRVKECNYGCRLLNFDELATWQACWNEPLVTQRWCVNANTITLWKVTMFYSPKPYRKSSIAVLETKVKSRNLLESERATDNCRCSVSESTITHRAPVTVMIQLKTTFLWTRASDQLHCKQRLKTRFKVRVMLSNPFPTKRTIDDPRFLACI